MVAVLEQLDKMVVLDQVVKLEMVELALIHTHLGIL